MSVSPATPAAARAFDNADVARYYLQRPPYATALYAFLLDFVPQRRRLLDLGCGPGKIAGELAGDFEAVDALDPSGPMIALGRELHAEHHPNIRWRHSRVEDAALDDAYDRVTAGASIHWMTREMLFPGLAELTPLVAVIGGDEPHAAPWQEVWRELIHRWLGRLGHTPDPAGFAAAGRAHESWLDIAGRETFDFIFHQPLEDFITCQHSRATWSRAVMGEALAREFDADIAASLQPWVKDGALSLEMRSELTWGAPRRTARAA